MDPDSYYSIILIIAGSFVALLSASISYLSQQKLKDKLEKDDRIANTLNKIRNRYEESLNSLFCIEILLYITAIVISNHQIQFEFKLLELLYFSLIILTLRIIFYFIGMRFANSLAFKFASILRFIVFLGNFFPFIADGLNKLSGGEATPDETKDEISAIMESALEDGSIDDDEYRILTSIMRFSDVQVEDVMTPRTVVFSLKSDLEVSEVAMMEELKNHSRIPIWDGENIDKGLRGYVMSRDILYAALAGRGDKKLKDLMKELYIVSEENPLDEALEKFLTRKQHIMAVVDEYGGFEGLITMEDVLETIIGVDIMDEADQEMDLRELAKRKRDSRIQKS